LTTLIALGTGQGFQPFSGILTIGQGIPASSDVNEREVPEAVDLTTAFLERPQHHDFENDHESKSARLHNRVFHREEPEAEDDAAAHYATEEMVFNCRADLSQAVNSEAPDDELHRRTTASCASYH
jgi:hypothetical protein